MTTITIPQLKASLIKHWGNYSKVARDYKMSRAAISDRINKSPELKQTVSDIIESMGDNLEQRAYDRSMETNDNLLFNVLKTKFKKRGYAEKQGLDLDGVKGITVTFDRDDDE